jgi:hypothetical protein
VRTACDPGSRPHRIQERVASRPATVGQQSGPHDRPVERAILDQAFLHILVVVGAAQNRNGNIWRQLMLARLSPAPNPVTLINRFTP